MIRADLQRLQRDYHELYPDDFSGKLYHTLLWTLLGELSIPGNLGEARQTRWPLLLFPFSQQYAHAIAAYITEHDFVVTVEETFTFSRRMHACLYGGQAWYPSLLQAYEMLPAVWGHPARLYWIAATPLSRCSLPALMRKMQLQLRPTMASFALPHTDSIYPGIVRAFHTPHLGNVVIHSAIFCKQI